MNDVKLIDDDVINRRIYESPDKAPKSYDEENHKLLLINQKFFDQLLKKIKRVSFTNLENQDIMKDKRDESSSNPAWRGKCVINDVITNLGNQDIMKDNRDESSFNPAWRGKRVINDLITNWKSRHNERQSR